MTRQQRLFLVQALSDFKVFELLRRSTDLPHCHALHYLQMATELFGKAYVWKDRKEHDAGKLTHRAFVGFTRSLATNRRAQKHLGYDGQNENWQHLIRKSVPLAQGVEDLAPALSGNQPNPEYPWPRNWPEAAPAEHIFPVWQELEETPAGRHFIALLRRLFAAADVFI
jgi:hypothetical protein